MISGAESIISGLVLNQSIKVFMLLPLTSNILLHVTIYIMCNRHAYIILCILFFCSIASYIIAETAHADMSLHHVYCSKLFSECAAFDNFCYIVCVCIN